MPRIVFFVLLLFVVWRVLSSLGKRRASGGLGADSYSRFSPQQRRRRLDLEHDSSEASPEELSECAHCGTFVPTGRALVGPNEAVYCDDKCRRANLNGGSSET